MIIFGTVLGALAIIAVGVVVYCCLVVGARADRRGR